MGEHYANKASDAGEKAGNKAQRNNGWLKSKPEFDATWLPVSFLAGSVMSDPPLWPSELRAVYALLRRPQVIPLGAILTI